jgi:hypothetical protein
MAVIYQNPLRQVRERDQIEEKIDAIFDPSLSYMERRDMISWLHGAIKVHDNRGHRAVVVYLKQVIHKCQQINFGTDSLGTDGG